MKSRAFIAFSLGLAVFIGLVVYTGGRSVVSALAAAGWGLLGLGVFHLLPLVLDAAGMHVLLARRLRFGRTLLARWVGESVNSLLPAGQMGGPVVMARQLGQHGVPGARAAAAVTVATTQQMLAQAAFALLGIALLSGRAAGGALVPVLLGATAVLLAAGACFYAAQRKGMFGTLGRLLARAAASRDFSALQRQAGQLDAAVTGLYRQRRAVCASFGLNLAGWLVGTGEVWIALRLVGHPVDVLDALLLESLGQAIRGAAFAVPGALGVQEGGYLLLAPLVGLPADAALALSLCKRARELMLGLPGLLYWHWRERSGNRRRPLERDAGAGALPSADSR